MSKLSAVVSVYNEEGNIERCLKSLEFADEIVVVDNSSTDKTEELARKFTDKVFSQKNDQKKIDIQKNFGFQKASFEWVLSIDADEEVSKELALEIKETISKNSKINGFWIPRKNIIFGKFIEHTGWYPDPQLRLFRKGKGKFESVHVHEPIKLEGESAYLKQNIIHHHYQTIGEFLNKTINLYVPSEVEEYLKKGYKFSYFDAVRLPLNEFLSRFFARKGYKDGFHGLILSLLMAFYHFLIFVNIWEKKGFVEYDGPNFMEETEKELRRSAKEIAFWVSKEKIESLKNPISKNLHKIIDKVSNL